MVLLIAGSPKNALFFLLDTGSYETHFGQKALSLLDTSILGESISPMYSISEGRNIERQRINISGLFFDGFEVIFHNHTNTKTDSVPEGNFIFGSGVLGSDIARLGKIRFNFPQGRISFDPYE